jgi:hypothetical protein
MGEIDEDFRKNIQKDSQYFGITLINEIISLLKNDACVDDNNNSNEESKEQISIFDIGKKKNKIFQEYIKKYYNKQNETFVEEMFQFHESKVKIDRNQLSNDFKLKKIDFETFLSVDLVFPYDMAKKKYNIDDLLSHKYSSTLSSLRKEPQMIKKSKFDKFMDSAKYYMKNLFDDNNSSIDNRDDYRENKNINKDFIIRKLYSLPNILILTINRVVLGKPLNNSKVVISEKLDLKDYLDENIYEVNTTYSLYGINECYKYKEKFGHNYSYVKIGNTWYYLDDLKILELEPNFESENVIGLFYIRDTFRGINNNK